MRGQIPAEFELTHQRFSLWLRGVRIALGSSLASERLAAIGFQHPT
jgi:hypothetical protein